MNDTEREFELPFYVNGTAPAAASLALEHDLATDPACAAELRELRSLRDALVEIDALAPASPDALFNDVMAKMGAQDAERPPLPLARLRTKNAGLWSLGLGAAACAALFLTHPGTPGTSVALAPIIDHRDGGHFGEDVPVVAAPQGGVAAFAAPASHAADMASANGTAAKTASSGSADARAASARQLARTGTIGLIVPDVTSALAKIQRLTQSEFGALTALQDDAPSTPGGKHTAQATVSVPDDRFLGTLDVLASFGGVTSRSVTTEDLTDSIVDNQARLRNLRHEEADLVRIMDRSGKISDVLDVEQQLAETRQSIEQLDAETSAMTHRVAYATISIALSDEKTVPVAAPGPGSQISDSWRAALHKVGGFTLDLVAQMFVLLVFLPYVLLLGVVAYLIRRRFWGGR